MSENRDIALRFMQALWAADFATTSKMFSDDAQWFFQFGMPQAQEGRGRVWPAREALQRVVDDLFGKFDSDGFTVTPTRTIADGENVAIEYEATGFTMSGRAYQNHYVTLLTVRDGKIAEIKPHNDTAHMLNLLAD